MTSFARCLAAVVLSILVLAACAGDPPITVQEGSVAQYSDVFRFADHPPIDFLFVVDGSAEAASLRAEVARLFAEATTEIRLGRGRWNPVDARAFVVKVGAHHITSPDDDIRLAWVESDATREDAERFAGAVSEAIETPAASPDAANVLETMRLALGAFPRRDDAMTAVVLVTAHDDATAQAESLPRPREGSPNLRYLAPCSGGAGRIGRWPADWHLAVWASTNMVETCAQSLNPLDLQLPRRCTRRRIARRTDGSPECRVRALVSDMDVAGHKRGLWPCESLPESSPRESVCNVMPLAGDDARRCSDLGDTCEGCASGWCVVGPESHGCEDSLRFIGGAAPAGVQLEVVCNVTR
ncbi:MAG: hypothetical protein K0S65_4838 [Labilithrix sp.]|nr:hypothetical protein [Labilithrix sp.]